MGDLERTVKSIIKKASGDVSKTSTTKQIMLGASSGWVTGFIAIRVGKTAALALGGAIILLQVANEKGYIKINWNKVNKKVDKLAAKIEQEMTYEQASWVDKLMRFARNNSHFTFSFVGGFLIGLASH